MAKKTEVVVKFTDDLDGSKADRTVSFALDNKTYEIDLSKKNAAALEKLIAPYVAVARRPERRRRGSAGTRAASRRGADLAAVRAWARANGFAVADRGRIPTDVVTAFEAAQ